MQIGNYRAWQRNITHVINDEGSSFFRGLSQIFTHNSYLVVVVETKRERKQKASSFYSNMIDEPWSPLKAFCCDNKISLFRQLIEK